MSISQRTSASEIGNDASAFDDAPLTITLFPGGAPGEVAGAIGPEHDASRPEDGRVAGRPLIRLGNVSEPTITVYRPKYGANGTAVIVCPGGGYTILANDLEGTEVCEYLNSIGVTAILLKYRVPERIGRPRWAAPLQDAQRALGIVRGRAAEFGIDSGRIGILGFSAGGHLAALLSNTDSTRTYDPIDDADGVSCRPDFTVLIYPAYLHAEDRPGRLSPELNISSSTPPAFLAQTEDDSTPVENSIHYFLALKAHNVLCEMHIYPKGGHGYGLRPSEDPIPSAWPRLLSAWLQASGLMPAEATT